MIVRVAPVLRRFLNCKIASVAIVQRPQCYVRFGGAYAQIKKWKLPTPLACNGYSRRWQPRLVCWSNGRHGWSACSFFLFVHVELCLEVDFCLWQQAVDSQCVISGFIGFCSISDHTGAALRGKLYIYISTFYDIRNVSCSQTTTSAFCPIWYCEFRFLEDYVLLTVSSFGA